MISQQRLKELFTFDIETGFFRWRNTNIMGHAGDIALALGRPYDAQELIKIDGDWYSSVELARAYVHGGFCRIYDIPGR